MTSAEIEKVFDWYSADQPQNATFQREIHRWNTFCQDLKNKPSSLLVAFILADSDYYPNIREIFHILLTMPIGSVPCERSIPALRRLKQWNRTAMVKYRLNGLALLHIQRLKKSLKIPKGHLESFNRNRTDNTMTKGKKTKGQTTIYKIYT